MLCIAACEAGGGSAVSSDPNDGGPGGTDGEVSIDGGPGGGDVDGGSGDDDGSIAVPDATTSDADAGTDAPGWPTGTLSTSVVAPTSGGGKGSSPGFRLAVSLGGAPLHGVGRSPSYKIYFGTSRAPR